VRAVTPNQPSAQSALQTLLAAIAKP